MKKGINIVFKKIQKVLKFDINLIDYYKLIK